MSSLLSTFSFHLLFWTFPFLAPSALSFTTVSHCGLYSEVYCAILKNALHFPEPLHSHCHLTQTITLLSFPFLLIDVFCCFTWRCEALDLEIRDLGF
jgi:hypothetical protein